MTDPQDDGRVQVTLARQLVNRGRVLQPGDEVRLRPDQIEALRADGYFVDRGAKAPGRARKGGQ